MLTLTSRCADQWKELKQLSPSALPPHPNHSWHGTWIGSQVGRAGRPGSPLRRKPCAPRARGMVTCTSQRHGTWAEVSGKTKPRKRSPSPSYYYTHHRKSSTSCALYHDPARARTHSPLRGLPPLHRAAARTGCLEARAVRGEGGGVAPSPSPPVV